MWMRLSCTPDVTSNLPALVNQQLVVTGILIRSARTTTMVLYDRRESSGDVRHSFCQTRSQQYRCRDLYSFSYDQHDRNLRWGTPHACQSGQGPAMAVMTDPDKM